MIEGVRQTLYILAICGPIILIPAFIAMAGESYLKKGKK